MSRRYPAGFIRPGYNPLEVPDAPTIGTATDTKEGTISIAFTAPSNTGGGAITGYIATVKKTSDGTTVAATGSSSPIAVTGLTNGSAYTVQVAAVNSFGPSAYSASSGSVTPTELAVGDAYEGGFFAGQISTAGNGVADYNLVIAPKSSGELSGATAQWKTSATSTSGTTSVIDGPGNTAAMIAAGAAAHPCANFCNNLSIGGFTDWYMPAQNEFELCYFYFKATTTSNNTSSGINTNAVPSRGSNYTAGSPAQTSVTDFISGNTESFNSAAYWASTEVSASNGRRFLMGDGTQDSNAKDVGYNVRAVRRVAI
jgi:hypothetical protein